MNSSYPKRFFICVLGLAIFGFGTFLGVQAGSAGTNAWNTLAIGISGRSGISFGTSNLLIGLVIILIDLLGKGKIGIGTFLNAFLVSWFADLFLRLLTFIPPASNAVIGVLYTLAGQTLLSFSTILYMAAGLGCGPRDTLMVIIGKRFPKAPIGIVKFCLEAAALIVGILLGAPFGIGTVLVMALQASIFQFACHVTRYEPRRIHHENLLDTARNLFSKAA